MRRTRLLVWTIALLVCAWGRSPSSAFQRNEAQKPDAREVIILGKDLLQILQDDPDAVILVGEQAKNYLEQARASEKDGPPRIVVQKCEIRGELFEDRARLRVEVVARCESEERSRVALGFGESTLLGASIDGGSPFLTHDSSDWIAWIDGRGQHTVVLDLQMLLSGSRTMPALVTSIPEATITLLELKSPRTVSQVKILPAAPVTLRPVGDPKPQIEAALGTRGKLELRWRWGDEPAANDDTLLRAVSQVAATVESGTIQLKTELRLQALRGNPQSVELRVPSHERILELRSVDGPFPHQILMDGPDQRVLLQFAQPLSGTTELTITRELPGSEEVRKIRGLEVQGAHSHWSQVVVRSAPELDTVVLEARNAQATDSLPPSLRSLRNEAAFVSYAQPYELELSVRARRTSTTVRSNILVLFSEHTTMMLARWQFSVHGGKVSRVDFLLPADFSSDQFLLTEAVRSVREEQTEQGRVAHVFLDGTPPEFELRMRSQLVLVQARGLVKLDLPHPLDSQSELTRLHVASTSEITLEPTPDLVPVEAPPDVSLLREIGEPIPRIRSFESRSTLDGIAFRLARSPSFLRHLDKVQVQLANTQALVTQSFDYSVRGLPVHRLRLNIPESIRDHVHFEILPGQLTGDSPNGESIVRWDGATPDPLRIQLNFRVPLEIPDSVTEFEVVLPLVEAVDGTCHEMDLSVTAPSDTKIRIAGGGWRPVSSNTTSAANSDPEWTFQRVDGVPIVRIVVTRGPAPLRPPIVVDRALISSVVGSRGEWRSRARYVVSRAAMDNFSIRVPAGSRLTRVRWGGRTMAMRVAPEPNTVDLIPGSPIELPAVLDIEAEQVAPGIRFPASNLQLDAPTLAGDISYGSVYWQLILPRDLALVGCPRTYDSENQLALKRWGVRPVPRRGATDLEQWLMDDRSTEGMWFPSEELLFSRVVSLQPLDVVLSKRPVLVLCCSGIVFVLGVCLVTVSGRLRLFLAILGVAMGLGFLFLEPVVAVECMKSAVMGLVLALAAGVCHLVLMRRHSHKRTIFPEPGVLARSQGSSVGDQKDPLAVRPPQEMAQEPASITAIPPRVATQRSSVR